MRGEAHSETFAELTGFQRDILVILAADKIYKGLGVKDELELYYDEEINHGRLYPNLDTLVEKGLISKVKIDNRTNGYDITKSGEAHLRQRLEWERSMADRGNQSNVGRGSPDSTSVEDETRYESVPDVEANQTEATGHPESTETVNGETDHLDDPEALIDEILRLLSEFDEQSDSHR